MTGKKRYVSLILILVLIILSFSACTHAPSKKTSEKKDVYIEVNGEILSKEYIGYFFYLAQTAMLEEAGYSGSSSDEIRTYWETAKIDGKDAADVARDIAADNAVSAKIQYLKAVDEGIVVTDKETEMINSDINSSAQSQGGMKEFEKFLVTKGTNLEAYRQTKLENVYIQKLYEKYDADGTLDISDTELSDYAASHNGEIDPEYILEYAKSEKFNSMVEQWKKDFEIIINDSLMKQFEVESVK